MTKFGRKFRLKVARRGHNTRQKYCSMEYTKAITEVLYEDGSLRDIYISINGVDGYRRLAAFLDKSGIPYSITMDDQYVDISTAIDEFSKGLNRLVPKLLFVVSDMVFIILTMGLKPSPLGDSFRIFVFLLQLWLWKTIERVHIADLTLSTILCG